MLLKHLGTAGDVVKLGKDLARMDSPLHEMPRKATRHRYGDGHEWRARSSIFEQFSHGLDIEGEARDHFDTYRMDVFSNQLCGQRLGSQRLASLSALGTNGLTSSNNSTGPRKRQLVISGRYAPCIEPLSNLRNVGICDLIMGSHNPGRKMTAKIVVDGFNDDGVLNGVLQDLNGDSILILVYRMPLDVSGKDLLPSGSAIAVKQPFLEARVDPRGNTSCCVVVHHPSDLHMLIRPDIDLRKQTPEKWRADGVAAVRRGEWYTAASCFTKGIDQSPMNADSASNDSALLRNRAIVLQDRGQHEKALYDANTAAALYPNTPLASPEDLESWARMVGGSEPPYDGRIERRRALALYGMRDWAACYHVLIKYLKGLPSATDDQASKLLKQTQQRWDESIQGCYEWSSIENRVRLDLTDMDVADYLRLSHVKPTKHQGRGRFVDALIPKGTVVLAEKAFAFARGNSPGAQFTVRLIHDLSAAGPIIRFGEDLVSNTIFKLQNMGPDWRHAFFDLHDGRSTRVLHTCDGGTQCVNLCPTIDGHIVIDAIRVHDIIGLNSMHCGPPHDTDRDRGIWINASYVNHACSPNCNREIYGDLLVLRTNRDIQAHEQLTIDYLALLQDLPQAQRRQALKANWGFDCDCEVCLSLDDGSVHFR